MTDWSTISSLATAGGTLVLAAATFTSIKAAQRSARVSERAMLAAQRPLLIPSRDDDPTESIRFGDGARIHVAGHGGLVKLRDGTIYLVVSLRNGGTGLAVIHGWYPMPGVERSGEPHVRPENFRRQVRDLYIPAGFTGFWQGRIADAADPQYDAICERIANGDRLIVDLLYGDHEGGQRAIARFAVPSAEEEGVGKRAEVIRYWNIDGDDPRIQDSLGAAV